MGIDARQPALGSPPEGSVPLACQILRETMGSSGDLHPGALRAFTPPHRRSAQQPPPRNPGFPS
jgi:hypothetical protein